jgi:IS6 family transposase
MKRNSSPFKWRHLAPDATLLCVRWYRRYSLSYRDLEEMMRERGLPMDHVTIFRRVRRYAPEINRRMRPHLRMSGTPYRPDETYEKVGTGWKYLYGAVDSAGDTIGFMLSTKQDVSAAKRFLRKLMRATTALYPRASSSAVVRRRVASSRSVRCSSLWVVLGSCVSE